MFVRKLASSGKFLHGSAAFSMSLLLSVIGSLPSSSHWACWGHPHANPTPTDAMDSVWGRAMTRSPRAHMRACYISIMLGDGGEQLQVNLACLKGAWSRSRLACRGDEQLRVNLACLKPPGSSWWVCVDLGILTDARRGDGHGAPATPQVCVSIKNSLL